MNKRLLSDSALQAVGVLLKHDPTASNERIADFMSEWGHLLEERTVQAVDFAEGEVAPAVTD
jgi:hypothetical protein